MTTTSRNDIYARVTDRIVAGLEQGTRPWQRPWRQAAAPISRPLRVNGTPYRGINVLLLWIEATARGFSAGQWLTYRQAQTLGGQVRKGESGVQVVYADRFTRTQIDDDGEEQAREIAFLKSYTVFNVEQIDNLPSEFYAPPLDPLPPAARLAAADALVVATGADVRHGGDQAFYVPARDYIQMPPFERFINGESYAATLVHELVHWSGHPQRLDRGFTEGQRYTRAGYAFEELVAEMGAAFVCAAIGVTPDVRDDHAAYLASWLEILRNDKRAIFMAATHAQRAADFLLGTTDAAPRDGEV